MRTDEAAAAFELLTAAYPGVTIKEETPDLFHQALAERVPDAGVALAVITGWVTTRPHFPRLSELLEECNAEARRRSHRAESTQAAQAHRKPGLVVCKRCDDHRMIDWCDDGGRWQATPCPDCDPDENAYWAGGHYDRRHDVEGCGHPRCEARAKQYEGTRAAGAHRLVQSRTDDRDGDDAPPIGQFLKTLRSKLATTVRPAFPTAAPTAIPLVREPESATPDVEYSATLSGTDEAGE